MTKKASQGTPALAALRKAGVEFTLHPYDPAGSGHPSTRRGERRNPQYGVEAAAALGVPQERIFKTLVADLSGTLAVAVLPVSGELDLKAFAAACGAKRAQLADPAAAERSTGYIVGGISPLGQKRRLATVVDQSAVELPTMYVSAGRRGLQVELAPSDLIRLTEARVAALT